MIYPSKPNELILLPVLKAHRGPGGGLVLTQKYLDGAAEYAKHWDGEVTTLAEVSPTASSDMDHVEVHPDQNLRTRVEERPKALADLIQRITGAGAVVGFLDPSQAELTRQCFSRGIPVIHVCEYTLKTEFQIIDATRVNFLRKLRRKIWIWNAERTRRELLGFVAGLQCNGVPIHDAYRPNRPDAFVFFDNRVRRSDVASDDDLARKAEVLRSAKPLRLIFGGRFVPMKGVLHLPRVARGLVDRGINFQFSIYGSGPEEARLVDAIRRNGVEDWVTIHQPMDFLSGWVPLLKREADLFVSCHPQGDPSSTYSEVMSCGVPIVGYANEAFMGIASHAGSGFVRPLGDAESMAEQIAVLDRNREMLIESAYRGRNFAREHCFEMTFKRRAHHFAEAAKSWRRSRTR